jgi:hypothetical protein
MDLDRKAKVNAKMWSEAEKLPGQCRGMSCPVMRWDAV